MSTAPMSAPLLLSVEEAAAQIRISRARMFELIRRGKVLSVKVGGSRRVPYDSLRAYVDQLITEQAPAGPESADSREPNPAA
jgi:excisionase family DNA binding protein